MRSFRVSPAAYRRITAFAVFALCAIVVTGAAVRLTGSGLGCTTWPNCEPGSLVPREESGVAGWIEFLNRLFTGVLAVTVIVAVLASRRRTVVRRDLVLWSYSLVAGVFANALLGGLVVLFELSPKLVAGHYLLSAVTIFCGAVLHHRAGEPDGAARRLQVTPIVRSLSIGIVVLAGAVLVSGTVVTGAGPHAGDVVAARLDVAVTSVARIHSLFVWALVATSIATWIRVRRGDGAPEMDAALRILIAVEVAQGAIGYFQYALGVPEELVAAHVLGSVIVWFAAVRVLLRTHTAASTASAPREPASSVAAA